jgi:hypothetical protein
LEYLRLLWLPDVFCRIVESELPSLNVGIDSLVLADIASNCKQTSVGKSRKLKRAQISSFGEGFELVKFS